MKTIIKMLPLILALLTAGCASVEKTSYVFIGSTTVAVEAARASFIDYANGGHVTQKMFDEVKTAYEQYQKAMADAQLIVAAYKANPTPGADNLNAALAPSRAAADALIQLVLRYLPPPQRETLNRKIGPNRPPP